MTNRLQGLHCGPMVGHTTDEQSRLWLLPEADSHVEVRYGSPGNLDQLVSARAAATPRTPTVLRLAGLQPETRYAYQVSVNGETSEEQAGSFTTAPRVSEPSDFVFGMTSCIKSSMFWRDKRQKAWLSLMADKPALQVFLGDCVYANSPHEEVLWRRHLHQRRVPNYAAAVRSIPTYAIWDDHDFFANDMDGDQDEFEKAETLRVFRKLWEMPDRDADIPEGVTSTWSWGQADFILMDGRYHRSDRRGVMLGGEQMNWLNRRLRESTALVKFVGSGSCLSDGGNGWRSYPREREHMLETLASVPNVFYLSGDIHECKFRQHDAGANRVIHEFISSGLARARKPFRPPTHRYVTVNVRPSAKEPEVEAIIRNSRGRAVERLRVPLLT